MGDGEIELFEMISSPFSGGWGVESVFFGFRLGDIVDVRAVRYCT